MPELYAPGVSQADLEWAAERLNWDDPMVMDYLTDHQPNDDPNWNRGVLCLAILIGEGELFYNRSNQTLIKMGKKQ